MITTTGWTVRQVDETPWPDIQDLINYWMSNPPLHLMLKGFMGIDGKDTKNTKEFAPSSQEEIAAMAAMITGK